MQIAKVLVLDDNPVNIQFFRELFKKWEMELIIVQDIENSLIRINILKPNLILISSDLKINYDNAFSTIFSRSYKVMVYGNNKIHPNVMKMPFFKGYFQLPINLMKFKTAFYNAVSNSYAEMQQESHLEVVVNEKVGVIELSGNVSWEQIHELKYNMINLIEAELISGAIFIFYEMENTEMELEENLYHLFSFITSDKLKTSFKTAYVKFLTLDNRVAVLLAKDAFFSKIEQVQSYAEGIMKIQSATLKKNTLGTDVEFIGENVKLVENVYDEMGNLVKKAGEIFTKNDIIHLKSKGIAKLYYPRELSALGINISNIDDVKKNIEELIMKQAEAAGMELDGKKAEKKLIIVIEDDSNTQKVLAQIINKMGYECRIAKDGIEGLQMVIQFNPNLIIVDLMMSKMNGVEFIKKYKELRKNLMSPIIVTSAISRSDIIQSVLKMGVNDYMLKPLDLKVLVDKIMKTIQ